MYDPLKGFTDFYPGEMASRRAIIDAIEGVANRYGFREIGTPALEDTQMYIDKSGPEIVEELYNFTDKGGRNVTLTPELTPTVARMVVARQQALSKPIKWYSTRPFWRYEQVQQGRFREFYQTNIDIFGSDAPEADAEILAVTGDFMGELGVPPTEFEFLVSHRDILTGLLETYGDGVATQEAIRTVDKRSKLEHDAYLDRLTQSGLTDDEAVQFDDVIADTDEAGLDDVIAAGNATVEAAVRNLRAVLAATEDFGAREYCTISLTTARGFDYYTGVVFECFDTENRVSRAIFGGGRYDNLIESFGGQPTPAVGVAPGVMNSTLPLLLEEAGVLPDESITTDYYVLQVGETRATAARIARDLRANGHVVETDVAGRSFGAQLEYADNINADTTVIVGEQDLANDEVTIKNMDSGEQTTAHVTDFPGDLNRPTFEDFT